MAILDDVLPSLQRLSAEYGTETDADLIARTLEKLRKSETVTFGEAKELYFCLCLAVARSDDWRLTGETIGALLEIRDSTKQAMLATAENEGKVAEFEAAERLHQEHLADFDIPGAPLRGFFGPQRSGFLWTVLKDPVATVRAIKVMERRGMDTTEIRKLAAKHENPADLEKDLRDAALLQELGVEEFSRRQGAANRRAAVRWALKGLCCLAVAALLVWIVLLLLRSSR